jgi:RTX calcium-binding nonapeptide repeat (4 copies)
MSEQIYMTYTTASATNANGIVLGSHIVLNYIDSNGLHHTLQAGPEVKFSDTLEKGKAFIAEEVLSDGTKNTDSPFKRIETTEIVTPNAPINTPFTLVAEGADLSSKWALMQGLADEVALVGYEYRPVSQNSNTFAGNALQRAGLVTSADRLYFQLATDPETGATKAFFVPGFGNPLANPINGAIPGPISLSDLGFSTQSFAAGDNTVLQANSIGGQAPNNIQNVSLVMGPDGQILRTETNEVSGSSIQTTYDSSTSNALYSETIARDPRGAITLQRDVFDTGTTAIRYLDTRNTHPYSELEIDTDASGKITAAKPTLDGQSTTADFSAVGQVLGSALGRALAPNNQFVQLAAGTVVGAVGQKLAQAFAASLTTNGATFDLASVFADFNVSIASAGASSVASFLVAELGTALHLDGFGGQLFNASAGGFTGSVASQVATKMAQGASFDLAIGTINFADAAASAAYGVSALFGSFLAHEFVPAQTHEGAVAGQLFGAIGSAAGISAALSGALGSVLGFIVPGLGSLIGTILGTLIGDAFGNVPHPAATDLLDQAGTLYAATHYQTSASDGGDYSTPDQMVVPALAIINAYLGAVKGAALDHHKQVTLGYQGGADGSVITVAIKVPNGVEVPGSLVAFADATSVSSDASGQTVQLQFGANLAAAGFHRLAAGAAGGDGANDIWFGGDSGQTFSGAGGHDILVGGAGNDIIHGGPEWDFIQGGAGNDSLFGDDGNDILRGGAGNDVLNGGAGTDAAGKSWLSFPPEHMLKGLIW